MISMGIGAACGQRPERLKDVFKDAFWVGTALNAGQVAGEDPRAVEIVDMHFNSITPENILKWEAVHPEPGRYDFEVADAFVAFGEKRDMFMVGHTLVWHSQTPRWVFRDASGNLADRETLLARMREHIMTVTGRYRGRIHGWDVVNEAVEEDGSPRNSLWRQIIGDDYIQKAFEYAHEADPGAELYYNDYTLWKPDKVAGVVRLVRDLQSKGVRIDAVGMQGHWGMDYPPLDEAEAAIRAFSELGVRVMVTELDVNVLPNPDWTGIADVAANYQFDTKYNPYPEALSDSMHQELAGRYADFFRLFMKYNEVISRVTFWGVHDGQSWLNHWPIRGRTNYPLLFDRDLQPKPAFHEVIGTVRK
ncbi:MAG TPA: endo-1,4-beta-xylanase [bacterium]|nr:endo-1,4-beta-xylanase [bacterium]